MKLLNKHLLSGLLLALAFLPAVDAFAATKYVSNSTLNGYSVGSDANTCTNQTSDACLTLSRAQTVAAASGDTIFINDGTYTIAAGLTLSKALSIYPATTGGVRIVTSSAPANVFQFSASQTFGAIEIDGTGITSANAKPSAGSLSFTTLGTIFSNCQDYCVDDTLGRIITRVSTGSTYSSTKAGATAVEKHSAVATSTYTYTGDTFTVAALVNAGAALTFTPGNGITSTATLTGNTFSVTANTAALNTKCAYWSGTTTVSVVNNICSSVGTTAPEGFNLVGNANNGSTAPDFHGNTISSTAGVLTLTDGHGIQIGDETDLSSVAITSPIAYNNTISGFSHLLYSGYAVTNFRGYRNTVSNGQISFIQEGGSAGYFYSNISLGGSLTGACIRSRHGTNNKFFGNGCSTDGGTYTSMQWIQVDDADSGVEIKDNVFINKGTLPAGAVTVAVGLAATITYNSFYSPAYAAGAFNIAGTRYNSAADWQTVVDSHAVITNPGLAGGVTPTAAIDFKTRPGVSPLCKAGIYIAAGYVDFDGNARHAPEDIGPYSCRKAAP